MTRTLRLLTLCSIGILANSCLYAENPSTPDSQKQQLEKGLEQLSAFSFERAETILEPLHTALSTDSIDWARVTYYLAIAKWHKNPPTKEAVDQAKALLNEVVEADPRSDLAASALLDLGRIEEVADFLNDPVDVEAAKDYYNRVRELHPNTDMSTRAVLFLAQCLAQSFEPEKIRKGLSLIDAELESQADSPWVGVLAQYAANLCAFYLDDPAAALPYYGKAVEVGLPRSAEADKYLWQYGLLAQKAGEDILAAQQFCRLVEEHPRSIFGAYARNRALRIAEKHPEASIEVPELSKVGLGQ